MQIIYLINAYHIDALRAKACTTSTCCARFR